MHPKPEQPGRGVVVPSGGVGGASIPGVHVGAILAGKYRIERVLGAGGMGQVFQATHLGLEQWVAIKCLLPDASASETLLARFQREARISAKIKSEHVARTLDVGQLPGGGPYIVMEYLQGCDLDQLLARLKVLPAERAVTLVLQAAEALAEAHALGIVHRDLKLANLFLTQRADGSDCVKVLDFGISKLQAENAALTRSAAFMGSPRYMSPEQLNSARDVDARTDIWALGAVLYFLLSGSAPFSAASLPDLVHKISRESPLPLGSLAPGLAPELVAVVERCLRKDPAQRFRSVGELARAVSHFGDPGARLSAARISAVLAEPCTEPTPDYDNTQRSFARTSSGTNEARADRSPGHVRRPLPLGMLAGLVVLALAIILAAGWLLAGGHRSIALQPRMPATPSEATRRVSVSAAQGRARQAPPVLQSVAPARIPPPASSASAPSAPSKKAPVPYPKRPRRSLPRAPQAPLASASHPQIQSVEPSPASPPTAASEPRPIGDLYRDRH